VPQNIGNPALCLSLSQPNQVAPGSSTCGLFGEDATYVSASGNVTVPQPRRSRSAIRVTTPLQANFRFTLGERAMAFDKNGPFFRLHTRRPRDLPLPSSARSERLWIRRSVEGALSSRSHAKRCCDADRRRTGQSGRTPAGHVLCQIHGDLPAKARAWRVPGTRPGPRWSATVASICSNGSRQIPRFRSMARINASVW
jgi:hypothetical protein